jgi:N-methylhydantoinase A
VFERVELPPGAHILGPALIVEDQTTTVVSEVFDARIDGASNLIVYRKNGR